MLFTLAGYWLMFFGSILFPYTLWKQNSGTRDPDTLNPLQAFFASLFLLCVSVVMHALGSTSFENMIIPFLSALAVIVITVFIGISISITKSKSSSSTKSFATRVVISSIAGIISSSIAYYFGIGEGVNLITASIGGVVFVTVSALG